MFVYLMRKAITHLHPFCLLIISNSFEPLSAHGRSPSLMYFRVAMISSSWLSSISRSSLMVYFFSGCLLGFIAHLLSLQAFCALGRWRYYPNQEYEGALTRNDGASGGHRQDAATCWRNCRKLGLMFSLYSLLPPSSSFKGLPQ